MVQLLLGIIYLSFISLGLPVSLLGAAWPTMYQEFSVPVFYAGGISIIISIGTIISNLQSDRLTRKVGTGRLMIFSVLMTAISMFGFSVSHHYLLVCLWALPYGLGAGSVDALLNSFVALHYASRHMSWLHCMWGIGAALGPYVMGYALTNGQGWGMGYQYIAMFQIVLMGLLVVCLPLWKKKRALQGGVTAKAQTTSLTLREVVNLPGAKEVMGTFFCYCALEQTTALWASSYLVLRQGLSTTLAASFASLFFVGITVGRALGGFMTLKLNDVQMIRLGEGIIIVGILLVLLPFGTISVLSGLIMIGLGCAPIYPSIIHSTPIHFGAERSQALIGVQMASANAGTCLMPPVFGLIATHISVALFPLYLLIISALMIVMHERLLVSVN